MINIHDNKIHEAELTIEQEVVSSRSTSIC